MEPFSISCTTCQAKLRVRDESAIGQIKTCPKCGSMVLIEAPTQPTDEQVPRDKGTSPRDRSPRQPPPRPGSTGSKKPNEFADTVEDPTHYGTANSEKAISPEMSTDSLGSTDAAFADHADFEEVSSGLEEPPSEVGPDELAQDVAWEPAGIQTRRWLLAGGAMVAGVGLAIAVFVYLASRGSTQVAQEKPDSKAVDPVAPSPTGDITTSPQPDSSLSSETSSEKVAQPPATTPTVGTELPATTNANPTPATVITPPDPGSSEVDPRNPAVPNPATEAGKERTPPELAPNNSDKAKADRMAPGGTLSDTLRKLGGLFDESSEPKSDSPPAEPVTTSTTGTPAAPPAIETPKLTRPAPRAIDIDSRLADQIVEIEFTDTPLLDFLQFVSTLSTIPISLDPDVLVWLKLTPNTPVTLKLSATTVAKLLESGLGKHGLVAVVVDNQLVVTGRAVAEGNVRTTQRNVADLVGSDAAEAARLKEQIQELIAPESWVGAGADGKGEISFADGKLEIQQTESVLLEISAFLERLRVARGLPKKSAFEERLFQPVSRTVRAAPQLGKLITLNYSRPTSFPKIVRRVAQEAGVSLLIDWRALAKAGWNPEAQVTLMVTNQSLGESLTALLQPMELAYRIVDESTMQITTPSEIDARHELEFYRVDSLLAGRNDIDGLKKRISSALPPGTFAEPDGGTALQWDPPSGCLLVLLPQPRQQALEKLLAEWISTNK